MTETVDALMLDLLGWIGEGGRPYPEVLEAWRTSCPRLPVWEEATDRGLVLRHRLGGAGTLVRLSALGRAALAGHTRVASDGGSP